MCPQFYLKSLFNPNIIVAVILFIFNLPSTQSNIWSDDYIKMDIETEARMTEHPETTTPPPFSNKFQPRFRSEVYFYELASMPDNGTRVNLEFEAYDPEDELNGKISQFNYGVSERFLQFQSNDLYFTWPVPNLYFSGRYINVTINATQVTGQVGNSAWATLRLKFPNPKVFQKDIQHIALKYWPKIGDSESLPGLILEGGLEVLLRFGSLHPGRSIQLEWRDLKFYENITPEKLGDLKDNRLIIFNVDVFGIENGEYILFATGAYIMTFPVDDDFSTGETQFPTTTDCPVVTCDSSITTNDPSITTNGPSITTNDPTSLTTVEPCDCYGNTIDTSSPATCGPCECDLVSTTLYESEEPCLCSCNNDELCNNTDTGLVIAVSITSVLCVAAIASTGFLLWRHRKIKIHK